VSPLWHRFIRADDAPGNEDGERSDGKVHEKDPAPTERIG